MIPFPLEVVLLIAVYLTALWVIVVKVGYEGFSRLFSYSTRRTLFHSLNPMTKILLEIAVFLLVTKGYLVMNFWLFVTTLSASLLILTLTISGRIRLFLLYFLSFSLLVFWSTFNSYRGTGILLLYWPAWFARVMGYSVYVRSSTVITGLISVLYDPVMFITLLGVILILSTNTTDLIRSFEELRIPLPITLIFASFLKVLPSALKLLDESLKMQILKGLGYGKPRFILPIYYFYGSILALFPAFVYLIRNVKSLAISLDTRGFRAFPRRTSMKKVGINKIDAGIILLSLTVIVFLLR
ncbi:hypothetical protein HS7_13560 [Sulfolobales archaeon HS-7]|nr:hypothetical protein HS7_13560 [Sulfolobales archaeon HS-7]